MSTSDVATVIQLSTRGTVGSDNWFMGLAEQPQMDSTDRGFGGDFTEVEPYGPPQLRQSAVQGVQISRTDSLVSQALPSGENRVRQDRAPSCRSSNSRPVTFGSSTCQQNLVQVREAQSYTE